MPKGQSYPGHSAREQSGVDAPKNKSRKTGRDDGTLGSFEQSRLVQRVKPFKRNTSEAVPVAGPVSNVTLQNADDTEIIEGVNGAGTPTLGAKTIQP
jgi:hypothetical protein